MSTTDLAALSQACGTHEWARSGECVLKSLIKGPPGKYRILKILYYCHCYDFFYHPKVSPSSTSGERLCLTIACHQKGSSLRMWSIDKYVFNWGSRSILGCLLSAGHCLSVNPGLPKLILFTPLRQEYVNVMFKISIDCNSFGPEPGWGVADEEEQRCYERETDSYHHFALLGKQNKGA